MRNLALRTYFLLRPIIPRTFRLAVRRFTAKRLRRLYSASWPINEVAGRAPDWWTGWPEGKKFAFVLTHDVEGKRGLARCRRLAELETCLGFRSCFNFVPEGEYATPESLRAELTAQGFEVGVHDLRHDGKLYRSQRSFEKQARKINHYLAEWGAVGFRSGFMLHHLDWIRQLNVLYDGSSFDMDPFEPQPDGVNTIFPFWVGRSDGSGYFELPYTLSQDSTLFVLLREPSIEIWKRKLDWVAQRGGLALVNVHPDYLSFEGTRSSLEYPARLYEEFLSYAAQRYGQEAWLALPKEVAAHAKQVRSRVHSPDVGLPAVLAPAPASGSVCGASAAGGALASSARLDSAESSHWRLQGRRVAMVVFSFYPADPRPRRAAEALVGNGMEVDLICVAEKPTDPRHEVVNGVNVLRLPVRRSRGSAFSYAYQYSAFLLSSGAILATRALTRGYDLVHVHNMPDFLVLSALVPKLLGAKVILDLHDPMPELMMTIYGLPPEARAVRLLRRIEKWSIALAHAVITVNRACAKMFAARSCAAEKVSVVMNAPDERIIKPRLPRPRATSPAAQSPFVLMYHGSLVERNGLDLAIDALARVRRSVPDVELRVYGWRTPYLDQIMESVRSQGLQDAVKYLGPKSLEQLVEVIDECDLGVIPNRRSIFTEINTPTRIFEYLTLGKPVLAPRAGGICEYFDDASLLFFELGNVEDLARKIEYAVAHPAELLETVRRGQIVCREHNWSTERLRLVGLVAGLLGKKVPGAGLAGQADQAV
jgi:glycosyltransferase involved in cell wall biosynthesis